MESGESFTSSLCHNGCEIGAEDPEDAVATGVITLVPEPAGAAWFAVLALGALVPSTLEMQRTRGSGCREDRLGHIAALGGGKRLGCFAGRSGTPDSVHGLEA